MPEAVDRLREEALAAIAAASDLAALEKVRIQYIGKNGSVKTLVKSVKDVPKEERGVFGKAANSLKKDVEQALVDRKGLFEEAAPTATETVPAIDISLPVEKPLRGTRHPIHETVEAVCSTFAKLGFQVVQGPEVEDEQHNFIGLNIPETHPARDPRENFYLDTGHLLRSQTSTVQIRIMENTEPPIRIVAPGKVFRPDTVDASHHYMFHQIEGLMVGERITFVDLKTVLLLAARDLFGDDVELRLRPSYFPFTEPSAELDFTCFFCRGKGCPTCGRTGFIEMGGCGMVDPNVFEAVGYDPEKWTGFAFGMGIDRLCMLRYGINDIRLLTQNDLRFLRQF